MKKKLENKNFTLVLSGGGALGVAHLGVIRSLESSGLSPGEVVGTSMGGIIGACVAIGMESDEIFELLERFAGVRNWLKFSMSGNAIIEHDKIEEIFIEIFGERTMKEVDIPLKLIATDLVTGEKKVFDSTCDVAIKDALLATMAIPGIFEEKTIDGVTYVDGFLCENLGIDEATCEDILAIDVMGKNSFPKTLPEHFWKSRNVMEMFERSLRILISNQSQQIIAQSTKNITLIEPNTAEYNTYDFHKIKQIKELGVGAMETLETF